MLDSAPRPLSVAVLANLKHSVRPGSDAPVDALAEYDSEETVEAILCALRQAGCAPFFLEADLALLDTLRETQPDICFNIAEGLRGDARESQVPALLEMLGIPYTGSGVTTHAISLDKARTKQLWRDTGLPTTPFQLFRHATAPISPSLAYPLFVKPVREGSGMGINQRSIVYDEQALRQQVSWVIDTYQQPALVEPYLAGREFTVGVLGNGMASGAQVSKRLSTPADFYDARGYHGLPILEIDTGKGTVRGIYNAQAKSYAIEADEAPGYLCPADIPAPFASELQDLAIAAFEALGGLDIGRVDFRLDDVGRPQLMEINTLPGLNPAVSDIVIAARAGGVPYEQLIVEILKLALARTAALSDPDSLSVLGFRTRVTI